jgi:hypothetical protein
MMAPIQYFENFIQHATEVYDALLRLPWQRRKGSFGFPVPRDGMRTR